MSFLEEKLNELRRVARLHVTWLVGSVLGKKVLSKEELQQVRSLLSLPELPDEDLILESYRLGRLKGILGKTKYSKLDSAEDDDYELSPVEELAVQQARSSAGAHLRNLGEDLLQGAFKGLEASIQRNIDEATVRDEVGKATAASVILKHSLAEFETELSKIFGPETKRNIARVAATELHSAKMRGLANAILLKRGPFQSAGGPDSLVSVVPQKNCCADCSTQYLDTDGNPKV